MILPSKPQIKTPQKGRLLMKKVKELVKPKPNAANKYISFFSMQRLKSYYWKLVSLLMPVIFCLLSKAGCAHNPMYGARIQKSGVSIQNAF